MVASVWKRAERKRQEKNASTGREEALQGSDKGGSGKEED